MPKTKTAIRENFLIMLMGAIALVVAYFGSPDEHAGARELVLDTAAKSEARP